MHIPQMHHGTFNIPIIRTFRLCHRGGGGRSCRRLKIGPVVEHRRVVRLAGRGQLVEGLRPLLVAHTENEAAALELREELKSAFPATGEINIDPLSLSVSCHIGPGALAIACAKAME